MKNIAWLLFSVLCLIVSSCGSIDVSSTFCNRDIIVDADAKDWHGLPLYTEKKVSFAVCNDSTYLYLLLTTSDRSLQRQLAFTGVNIWFDAKGGTDKTYGIHYPLRTPGGFGMQRDRSNTGARDGREEMPGDGQQGDTQREEPSEPPRMMDVNSSDTEILGPNDDKEILALAEAKDLQLKMSSGSGLLVFELRVPLVRDPLHPHGIGTSLAAALGVGMETPEFDFPKKSDRGGMQPSGGMDGEGGERGGGMPPGGMGGGRGGRGGGHHGGGPEGGSRSSTESVSLWANVKLAGK